MVFADGLLTRSREGWCAAGTIE